MARWRFSEGQFLSQLKLMVKKGTATVPDPSALK